MNRKLFFFVATFLGLGLFLTTSWSSTELQRMTRWHVDSNRSKPKAANEYDVIVVGGGFGGLSCGSMLAKNGYKVLLLEKNAVLGGLCSSYEKDGFQFDYGAENISGFGERGAVKFLLTTLGLQQSELFVPNTHMFLDGAHSVVVGIGPDAFEKSLEKTYPKESRAIRQFFDKAKEVYSEGYDSEMVKKWGIILPEEMVSKVMSETWVKNYPSTHKNLLEWSKRPYQEVLDEYFSSSEIKAVLSSFVSYLGAYPYNTPASAVVIKTFGYFFFGGYQALGTAQRFADVLASSIKEHGGAVLCNQHVDKILVGKNGVKGVLVGEDSYVAPVVVCNVNAKTAYFDLIDSNDVPPDFLKELWALPLGNSALSLHLAVENRLLSYSSILQDRYNHTYIAIPTKNDPSLAPEGWSTVIVRETVRFTSFIRHSKEENEAYLKARTDDLFSKGKSIIPELAEGVVIKRVITPDIFAEISHVPYGAIYGFDSASPGLRPGFRGPIRGLYMSSASSGGAGVNSVIETGILCAHDIMGWKTNPG